MEKDSKIPLGKWELFNHIKEESVKDPFYMTKILLSTVGKNTVDILVRIALYVIVVYPALTTVLHVPNGVAALLVVVGIILYHSSLAIYHRIVNEAKDNNKGEKKNGLSGV